MIRSINRSNQSINPAGELLTYMQPSVYSFRLPPHLAEAYPLLKAAVAERYSRRKAPFSIDKTLSSAGGTQFRAFMKHRKWGKGASV